MAIYHLHSKIGSKEDGQSAGAKCAYITRTEKYSKKADECAYTASGNMPKWPKTNPQNDPAHYWKAADTYERDNGRLFRELIVALPRELTLDQQKALCHDFAEKATTLKDGGKLPFTLAIHIDPENHNPHCHLMISERINDGIPRNASTWFKRANPKEPKKGGALKSQELNGPKWLNPTRETWATLTNEALKNAGSNERIDHRSYATQGVDAIAQSHIGPTRHRMMKKGERCETGEKLIKRNEKIWAANQFQKHVYPVPSRPFKRMIVHSLRVSHGRGFSMLRKDGKVKTWKEIINDILSGLRQSIQATMEAEANLERLRRNNAAMALAFKVHEGLSERPINIVEQESGRETSGAGSDFKPSSGMGLSPPTPFAIPRKPKPKGIRS